MIKEIVERKVPVYLVTIPGKGITRDCPIKLREKENKRRALTMLIMLYSEQGKTDQEIIEAIEQKQV